MKDKYLELVKTIREKLAAAEVAVNAGDFEKAKTIQAEIAALRGQAEVIKAHLSTADSLVAEEKNDELATLKARNAELEAEAKKPKRPPFTKEGDSAPEPENGNVTEATYAMRYGETNNAVKAVLNDLYGPAYHEGREKQRGAFVKYLRFGNNRLNAQEAGLLEANRVYLTPDTVEQEVKAGRSVAEIKATLIEGSLDLGGVLVPEDYRAEIIKRLAGITVVRPRARVIQTTRDAVEWPKIDSNNAQYTSAVRVTWVNENPASATTAATNPTFALERVPVHTVMARTDLSRNLLEDSAFNLLDTLAGLFAEAMAIDEDTQFLTGTGGGRPFGILGDRSGAEQVPVTGVTNATTGNATQMTADGMIDLVYLLHAQYRKNAVLVAAKNTHRDLRKIKDGTSNYLWEKNVAAGQPPTLLGYPVYEDEGMPAVAANSYPVLFGDFSGYMIADRVGMTVERVADTTTVGTNTVAMFARRRLGGQTIEPWRFVALKVSA